DQLDGKRRQQDDRQVERDPGEHESDVDSSLEAPISLPPYAGLHLADREGLTRQSEVGLRQPPYRRMSLHLFPSTFAPLRAVAVCQIGGGVRLLDGRSKPLASFVTRKAASIEAFCAAL